MGRNAQKLPVFNTIWTAAKLPFLYRGVFVRVALVTYPIMAAGFLLVPVMVTSPSHRGAWMWGIVGVGLIAFVLMAVAWHRLVILGERRPDWLAITRRGVLYGGLAAVMGPGMDAWFGVMELDRPTAFIRMVVLIASVLYVVVLVPAGSLVLPMIAAERRAPSVRRVADMLSGNWFRFLGVVLIGEGLAWLVFAVISPMIRFITWDVLLSVLDVRLAGPSEVDRVLLTVVSMPTTLMLALVYLYAAAFVAGQLSVAYVRLRDRTK